MKTVKDQQNSLNDYPSDGLEFPTTNLRFYSCSGRECYNLYEIPLIDGEVDYDYVEQHLPDGVSLESITVEHNEIDDDGNLL